LLFVAAHEGEETAEAREPAQEPAAARQGCGPGSLSPCRARQHIQRGYGRSPQGAAGLVGEAGMIRASESGVPVPPDVVEACQTGAFRDHALAELASVVPTAVADPERPAPPYLSVGSPLPGPGLSSAEADARRDRLVGSTNISDDVTTAAAQE
jgi:hypothetical protein